MIDKDTIWIKAITPPYGKVKYDGEVIDTGKEGEKIFTLPEKFALARLRVYHDMFQRVILPDEVMELITTNVELAAEIQELRAELYPKTEAEPEPGETFSLSKSKFNTTELKKIYDIGRANGWSHKDVDEYLERNSQDKHYDVCEFIRNSKG